MSLTKSAPGACWRRLGPLLHCLVPAGGTAGLGHGHRAKPGEAAGTPLTFKSAASPYADDDREEKFNVESTDTPRRAGRGSVVCANPGVIPANTSKQPAAASRACHATQCGHRPAAPMGAARAARCLSRSRCPGDRQQLQAVPAKARRHPAPVDRVPVGRGTGLVGRRPLCRVQRRDGRYAIPLYLGKRRVSAFRKPSWNSNGNTFDFQGRQLSCQDFFRRVVRWEPTAP